MNDSCTGSVTGWLQAVRTGDDDAATDLWDRYFQRLVGMARRQLVQDPEYDEEDLAVSVFDRFFRDQQQGRFSLDDREDFWSLLVVMTLRKANDRRKRMLAGKRQPPGNVLVDAGEAPSAGLEPDLAAMMSEQCRILLRHLADPELEQVAVLKLEGYSNQDIANALDCSLRSVNRMLNLIRTIWRNRSGEDAA